MVGYIYNSKNITILFHLFSSSKEEHILLVTDICHRKDFHENLQEESAKGYLERCS